MKRLYGVCGMVLLVLAGCGSNGGGDDTPPIPDQGFVEFTRSLAATSPETSEPVDVDAIATVTPDDTEPEQFS